MMTSANQMQQIRRERRWPRYVLVTLLGLLLLLVLALGLTQTQWFRDYLRDKIVAAANVNLDATLRIASIHGNLYSNVRFDTVMLTHARDTLLAIPSIEVHYKLWDLIHGDYTLDSISIVSPFIAASQNSSGTWNWQHIMRSETGAASTTNTTSPTPPVTVGLVRVIGGALDVLSSDTLLTGSITQLDAVASGQWTPAGPQVTLSHLGFRARTPILTVEHFATRGQFAGDSIGIDTLMLTTTRNQINGSGQFTISTPLTGTLILASDTLDMSEFFALTGGLPIGVHPNVKAAVTVHGDSTRFQLDLDYATQHLALDGWLSGLSGAIGSDSTVLPSYSIRLDAQAVRFQDWLANSSVPGTITGWVTADGQGIDPPSATTDIKAELSAGSFGGYKFDTLSLSARYTQLSSDLDLRVNGRYGRFRATGTLSDLLTRPGYALQVTGRRIDISALPNAAAMSTDLNFDASLDGFGLSPDSLRAHCIATFFNSRIEGNRLDTLFAEVRYEPGTLDIDTLGLRGAFGTIHAGGQLGLDRRGTLHLGGTFNQIGPFAAAVGADTLSGHGSFDGQATGRLDSLALNGTISAEDVRFDDVTAQTADIILDALYTDSLDHADFVAQLRQIMAYDYPIDSLQVNGRYADNLLTSDAHIYRDPVTEALLSFDFLSDTVSHLTLSSLDLVHKDLHWRTPNQAATVALYDDHVEVRNLRLVGSETQNVAPDSSGGTLTIEGVYGYDSTQAFTVGMSHVDIAALRDLAGVEANVQGRLSGAAHTSGSILNPSIDGHALLTGGNVNGYTFDSLRTEFSYADTTALVLAQLHVQGPESLTVVGTIPLQSIVDSLSASPDTGLDVRVRSFGFTLGILKTFGYTVEQAQGELRLDLRLMRSLSNPSIVGTFGIDNGTVTIPEYGIDYTGISALIDFDSTTITLDHLIAKRDKGKLTVQGQIRYANGLATGSIDAGHMTLMADKFYLVRHRHYQVEISANASLHGDPERPTYDGTVTVLRSNFYLPAFATIESETDPAGLPLLVAATSDTSSIADTLRIAAPVHADSSGLATSQIVENLRGRMTVKFPRNTWLYDEDMRVEISGELEIVKESAAFELFGTIDVVRGYYDLYGRRFTIKEGTLTFEGGDTINPKVAINAVYNFRTPAREKKQLILNIGGFAETPELQFSLDDAVISEGDAVSYLLFGQNLDALTTGQRKAVIGENTSRSAIARGAITNLLAGKLTETLGKEFSLDVIEINAQSDWRSASFLVGKYLTTDLFVSYQRGVGTARDQDEIVPEIVTLEYELSRHLFLQLVAGDARSSGFDVIVKFDSR